MIQYDEYRIELLNMQSSIDELQETLNIDSLKSQIEELDNEASQPGFFYEMSRSHKVLQKSKNLKDKVEKFENFPAPERSANGLIYSKDYSNMCLSVRITDQIDLDDHTLFIGEVTEDVLLCDKKACTYDYYLKNIASKGSL